MAAEYKQVLYEIQRQKGNKVCILTELNFLFNKSKLKLTYLELC